MRFWEGPWEWVEWNQKNSHGWRNTLSINVRTDLITNKMKRAFVNVLVWHCTPVFPALGKLRQKGFEFKACIVYMVRLPQKQKTNG